MATTQFKDVQETIVSTGYKAASEKVVLTEIQLQVLDKAKEVNEAFNEIERSTILFVITGHILCVHDQVCNVLPAILTATRHLRSCSTVKTPW